MGFRVKTGAFRELPSYFLECLAYNCPDSTFANSTWTETLRAMLVHIWHGLQGEDRCVPRTAFLFLGVPRIQLSGLDVRQLHLDRDAEGDAGAHLAWASG